MEEQSESSLAPRPGAARIPRAIALGLGGAMLGAIAWALVANLLGLYAGAIALLIGWLSARGVVKGSGGQRSRPLQIAACACAVVGIAFAKYFAWLPGHLRWLKVMKGIDAGYFDLVSVRDYLGLFPSWLGAVDLLWLAIAVWIAWIDSAAKAR